MAHVYRFFGEGIEAGASEIVLSGEEAHHALHVVRVKAGDALEVFDRAGRSWSCEVRDCSRKDVVCDVTRESFSEQALPQVFVSMAWLGKDKGVESLIQRCTELGVAGFRFFRGAHSVKDVKVSPKWERWAVEACKQSGRVYVPSFEACEGNRSPTKTSGMTDLVGAGVIRENELTVVGALKGETVKLGNAVTGDRDVNVVIGPEGDFSQEEYAALCDAGAAFVSLGDGVYRSEVAGGLLAGLVMYELGRLS